MQKDATMQAANMANLGKVALMQEPVAAVMSVMRARNTDGMFLIYDLGGGTLDIAIAESIGGRVNLLAQGGIAMCGGRDFDRALFDNIVRPWLLENFDFPEDFSVNPDYKALIRLATRATEQAKIELSASSRPIASRPIAATEQAKIELSAREDLVISLSEAETSVEDLNGKEIYLDVPLLRDAYDKLIAERVDESIESARETLNEAGLSPHDLESIVFVGGPTSYKPLRDKVAFELGIDRRTDVNPMTAVAEGASLFAESIDWSSQNRSRKNTRGQISSGGELPLSFNYIARTPGDKAKIAVQLASEVASGSEFQIDSVDTGWTSGRLPLKHGATIDITLTKTGENTFKVFVFDPAGGPIAQEQDKIVITRTAATVDAIPASHSVRIQALEKLGGPSGLYYLVRKGDSLPKNIKKEVFKAALSLKSGAFESIDLNLWEGEIDHPITDNRLIGAMKISGSDFDDGVIHAGADLICDFEFLDSGLINIEVSVPCISASFRSGKNFYSRQDGQIDFTAAAAMIVEEGEETLNRIDEINEAVDNPKLEQARQKLESATALDPEEADTEKSQEAKENVLEARRLLAQVRKEHLKEIRQIDLDSVVSLFNGHVREHARPSEATAFDNLAKTAQRSIDRNDKDFEYHLDELRRKNFGILWRQDWFVLERFKLMASSPHLFADKHRFKELAQTGTKLMRSDEIEKLRAVVAQLSMIQIGDGPDNEMLDVANIIRG